MISTGIDAILARHKLYELEEYLNTSEKQLKKTETEFKDWIEGQKKKIPPEELGEFLDDHGDDYWLYESRFPRILRNLFLVSCWAVLEREMTDICNRLKRKKEIPISLGDLRRDIDVLERGKLYFKLAGLSVSYNNQTWQELKRYYIIRNCIVHKNGLVSELQGEKHFMAYLTSKGIISDDTIEQEIALNEQFCREVINTIRTFLENLYNAYHKHERKTKS